MDFSLEINGAVCIKCGRCVRVCPSAIFTQEDPASVVGLRNISYCISCGHCAAVCPTGAVLHSSFPPIKAHPIDNAVLPSPESVMLLLRSRRSNRAFDGSPVPDDKLRDILEAAHRAPTASNRQEVRFVLITDKDKLEKVIEYTMNSFGRVIRLLKNPLLKWFLKPMMPDNYRMLRRMERLLKEYAKGNDPILRGATALILIYAPGKNRFGRDDANLAYQNGSLMAESLGVAQFYTGYVCTAIRRDRKNRLAGILDIEGSIHAGMALGMPSFKYPNYIDRKEISVREI